MDLGWFHDSSRRRLAGLALRVAGALVPLPGIPDLCSPPRCPPPAAAWCSDLAGFFLLFVLVGLSVFIPVLPFSRRVWAGSEEIAMLGGPRLTRSPGCLSTVGTSRVRWAC